MKKAGQIVAFRFPQTDLKEGKLRPRFYWQNYQANMMTGWFAWFHHKFAIALLASMR